MPCPARNGTAWRTGHGTGIARLGVVRHAQPRRGLDGDGTTGRTRCGHDRHDRHDGQGETGLVENRMGWAGLCLLCCGAAVQTIQAIQAVQEWLHSGAMARKDQFGQGRDRHDTADMTDMTDMTDMADKAWCYTVWIVLMGSDWVLRGAAGYGPASQVHGGHDGHDGQGMVLHALASRGSEGRVTVRCGMDGTAVVNRIVPMGQVGAPRVAAMWGAD